MTSAEYGYVLGIQSFANQDSGACLLRFSRDGAVLDYVAISEERLLRRKYPYTFPVHSIGYCMDHYGLESMDQVDLLVSDFIRVKRWFNSGPGYNTSEYDYLKLKFDFDPEKIVTISHHMAHAASTFYASGFDDAAVLVVDGNGSDLQTTSFFDADNGKIRYVDEYKAHGIGAVYNIVTKWILNLGTGGEGKTMGLAPFGANHPQVLDIEGKLDGIRNNFSNFMRRQPYSDVINYIEPAERISPLRDEYRQAGPGDNLLDPYFSRIAFDVQKETERVFTHLGKEIEKRTGRDKICLAGGVALNSVANKIMFDATGFKEFFAFPACSDAGIPFGLAVWGYYNARELGSFERKPLNFRHAYTGVAYGSERVGRMLERYGIAHEKTTPHDVAQIIADGNIIGWFQGGSEYGPRALGHRSILADARRSEMTDIVNSRVKHREGFRPFAPAVLLQNASEYFELDGPSPYMLLVAKVKLPDKVPAITHVDGTARVQTLTSEDNGVFYDLVEAFDKITGVPVILNTSFNDAGEPIVETPEDAMISFLRTDVDYLVLEDYIVDAKAVDKKAVADRMAADRDAGIAQRYSGLIEKHFPGYDADECQAFIEAQNGVAAWHVRYSRKFVLENQVAEWIRERKRIMIVGTEDHTALLKKHINRFWELDVAGFVPYEIAREQAGGPADHGYEICTWDDLARDEIGGILVSTYEYAFEIQHMLRAKGVETPVFQTYDSSSRSMFETLSVFPAYRVA